MAPTSGKGKGARTGNPAPTDERFASSSLSAAAPRDRKGKGKVVPTDERFASLASDPRFIRKPRRTNTLAVDERFKTVRRLLRCTPAEIIGLRCGSNGGSDRLARTQGRQGPLAR